MWKVVIDVSAVENELNWNEWIWMQMKICMDYFYSKWQKTTKTQKINLRNFWWVLFPHQTLATSAKFYLPAEFIYLVPYIMNLMNNSITFSYYIRTKLFPHIHLRNLHFFPNKHPSIYPTVTVVLLSLVVLQFPGNCIHQIGWIPCELYPKTCGADLLKK